MGGVVAIGDPVMATLHLVRHGQTTSNVMRRLDTALPGAALTDFGARQAIRFGLDRPDVKPAALFSSRARRAMETAELIGSAWAVTPKVLDGIHEVQVGELEDRIDPSAHKTFARIVDRWYTDGDGEGLPGGETWHTLRGRFVPVLEEIAKKHLSGADARDVFVVSHGAAIRLIGAYLGGVPASYAIDHNLPNLGTVELNYTAGEWTCISWRGHRSDGVILPRSQPQPCSCNQASSMPK